MQLPQFDGSKSWITDNSVDDPKPLPKISSYHVLVRPIKIEEKVGSVYLADSFKDDVQYLTNVGRVLAVGPSAFKDNNAQPGKNPYGRFGEPLCGVGDYVVWGKNRGTKIKVKGVSLVVLQDEELLMKVDDPNDVNPLQNIQGVAQYRS